MELVYLWIKQYKNLNNVEVQLNPKYKVKLNKQNLSVQISENKDYFNIFGDNINIIALAGENGCGKSNFIDAIRTILGSAQNDASKYLEFKYILIFKLRNNKNFHFLASEDFIKKLSKNPELKHYQNILKSVLFRQFSPTRKYDEYDYPTKTETMIKYRSSYLQGCFYYDDFGEVNNFYSLSNMYQFDYNVHPLLLFKDEPQLKFEAFKFSVLNEFETEIQQRLRNLHSSRMPIIKNLVKEIIKIRQKESINIIEDELSVRLIELLRSILNNLRLYNKQEYIDITKIIAKSIEDSFCEQIKFVYKFFRANSVFLRMDKDFQEFMSLVKFFIFNDDIDFEDLLYEIRMLGSKYYPIKDFKGNNILDYLDITERNPSVEKFLNSIINVDFVKNLFNFSGGSPYSFSQLSTGEQRILRFLSDIITLFYVEEVNFGKKPLVVFFDEIDLSWHPEWQRKLILYLVDIVKNLLSDKENVTFIISTHSPFILSDIPSQNVVLMERTCKDIKSDIQIKNNADFKTFGTNIHTMLANNFFMKSTIGAFAEKTIKEVIKNIRSNQNPEFCNNVIELMDEGIYKTLIKNMQLYQFNNVEDLCNEEN